MMSVFEVFVDGVCRYYGYSLDIAADAFEEYAEKVRQGRGCVSLYQDGNEVKTVGA
jgi:hypothetical protein